MTMGAYVPELGHQLHDYGGLRTRARAGSRLVVADGGTGGADDGARDTLTATAHINNVL